MTSIPASATKLKNYKFSENSFLPKTVTVMLRAEKTLTYKCLVRPGDVVEEGEVIAKPSDENSTKALIHSPLPGKVIDILPVRCADGTIESAVKIQFGGKFNYSGKKLEENKLEFMTPNQIQKNLTDNGILNLFDIVYPVSLGSQIEPLKSKKERNLVVRLFDDDTTMLCDSLYSKFFLPEIVKGAWALAKAIETENVIFVADSRHGLKQKIEPLLNEKSFFFEVNSSKYPVGNSKAICRLYSKCKRKPQNIKSISIDDLFVDSGTLHQVYKSVYFGIPSLSRYIHFSGNCIPVSCFLNIRNGTTLKEIVGQLGNFVKNPSLIIVNGQIRGNTATSLDVPLFKNVKSVYFLSSKSITDNEMYQCINCGNCRVACPQHIAPDLVYNFSIKRLDVSEFVQKSAALCTQCNVCNSVCPARLPLSQAIVVLKKKIIGNMTNEE
ncbi:MAG: 4Fe-4S dicluster domain-containing protein [Treponema sp.]|nr:4Fe-4S dicluster domain-containing protein [Treponema sp.]